MSITEKKFVDASPIKYKETQQMKPHDSLMMLPSKKMKVSRKKKNKNASKLSS